MTIHDVRRRSIVALIGSRFGGVQARFGTAIGRQADYISRVVSGKKPVGERLARDIERCLGMAAGSLDREPEAKDSVAVAVLPLVSGGRVPILSWQDVVLLDQEEEATRIMATVNEWAPRLFGGPEPDYAVRMVGTAMEPEFRDGWLLYVDRRSAVKHGDFVVALPEGRAVPMLRQLQVDGDRMYLRAMNPTHPEAMIPLGSGRIVGKVVHQAKSY